MDPLQQLADRIYYGNSLQRWAEALLIFVLALVLLPAMRLSLDRRLKRMKPHESLTALELMLALIEATTKLFIVALGVYLALKSLELPPKVDHRIDIGIEFAVWVQAALWGGEVARFLIDRRVRGVAGGELPTLTILRFLSLVLIWALAVLMLLSNLGVNITALVTSLGIGGVAFALAIQNVLGDVLASLAIAFDKPFQLGDELHIDELIGNVEHIGVKSTRLRSIDGEQIVIANSQILQARIKNFGRATEQRIALVLTLAFDTPLDVLRGFPTLVDRVVKSLPAARLQRCALRGLGAAGFDFDIGLYATDPHKTPVPALREQFTLRLLAELETQGIGFAAAGSPVLARKPAAAPAEKAPA